MSDLDKAIRDHLARVVDETMERRNGLTSILPGTEMARVLDAIPAALGALHEAETFNPGMTSTVELVRARLAHALGVSGEDRSEPTPAPRRWRDSAGDLWREYRQNEDDLLVLVEYDGSSDCLSGDPVRRSEVEREWGPLSEVVTPEGPA